LKTSKEHLESLVKNNLRIQQFLQVVMKTNVNAIGMLKGQFEEEGEAEMAKCLEETGTGSGFLGRVV
jgi:hypothetical protein